MRNVNTIAAVSASRIRNTWIVDCHPRLAGRECRSLRHDRRFLRRTTGSRWRGTEGDDRKTEEANNRAKTVEWHEMATTKPRYPVAQQSRARLHAGGRAADGVQGFLESPRNCDPQAVHTRRNFGCRLRAHQRRGYCSATNPVAIARRPISACISSIAHFKPSLASCLSAILTTTNSARQQVPDVIHIAVLTSEDRQIAALKPSKCRSRHHSEIQ